MMMEQPKFGTSIIPFFKDDHFYEESKKIRIMNSNQKYENCCFNWY